MASSTEYVDFIVGNLWICLAAVLVFIMHLGFSMLEAGMIRSKNVVNILFKNVGVVAIGTLVYAVCGFNLMYPGDATFFSFFGFAGFGIGTNAAGITPDYNPAYTYWADFIFQAMFAATAATIVSGAVAGRIKLSSFLIFSGFLVGISYSITGMWKWGGGFLDALGFYDFAGSTIVHSVGGWAALVAVLILGSRTGRYDTDKKLMFGPHNFPLSTIGMFLLFFGWFGFNGGSVLSADPGLVSFVFVTTILGGLSGTLTSMITSWSLYKRPDLTNVLNGSLAGLVSITAGADVLTPLTAVLVGGIGGIIVVFSADFFNRLKIDDPVGAISVHLVCGIWGTLAVGLFGQLAGIGQVINQFIGIVSIGLFTVIFSGIVLTIIQKIMGLRVPIEDEQLGLDHAEHKDKSYIFDHV